MRFVLELAALAALAAGGAHAGHGPAERVGLALLAPLFAAAVWGAFVAPRARWPVPVGVRLAIEVVVFGGAFAGVRSAGGHRVAWVFAVAVAVDYALLIAGRRPGSSSRPRA